MEGEIILVILAFVLMMIVVIASRQDTDEKPPSRRRVKFAKRAVCRKYGKSSGRIIEDTECSV